MKYKENTDFPSLCDGFVDTYWNEATNLPKHEKLRKAFTDSIKSGFWPTGARLPTEAELVRATPCSLGTVQRALRALVADGLVVRRQGSGTVVAKLSRPLSEPWHIRFRDPDNPDGSFLPVYTKVIERSLSKNTGPWSDEITQQGKEILRIERTFAVQDRLRIYAVFYALSERFPELTHLPIEQLNGENFKKLIAQRHHLPIHRIRQSINAVLPPAPAIKNSDCIDGVSAMHLMVTTYSINEDPLYYQEFFIPPTILVLELN